MQLCKYTFIIYIYTHNHEYYHYWYYCYHIMWHYSKVHYIIPYVLHKLRTYVAPFSPQGSWDTLTSRLNSRFFSLNIWYAVVVLLVSFIVILLLIKPEHV